MPYIDYFLSLSGASGCLYHDTANKEVVSDNKNTGDANYVNDLNCFLTVEPTAGMCLFAEFIEFEIDDSTCMTDYVSVAVNGVGAGVFCGSGVADSFYLFREGTLTVSFTSDGSGVDSGFRLAYRDVDCNCKFCVRVDQ